MPNLIDRVQVQKLLDERAQLIVYCYDAQWDLSARAAGRLETYGFTQVFRYLLGKADWAASGLPTEGKVAAVPRAGAFARRNVPTCELTEPVNAVCERIQAEGWEECVVINNARVVLGRLQPQMLDSRPGAVVETVMEAAPNTIRPNTPLKTALRRMQKGKTDSLLVTTSDGKLVGVLDRRSADQVIDAPADETKA